ncbi:hypothetical protein [Pseudomonas azerbaijanoccidentalis]
MNRSADYRYQTMKWMREPSSCTRIVVIASGFDSDHIDLMHHGFSCFDNIALMQVEADTGSDKFVEVQADYSFVVFGQLDERLLHGKPCVYHVTHDTWAERSVIDAVEHVKSLARVSHSRHLEALPDSCRRCS